MAFGTDVAACTTDAGAGATGGATTAVVPRVTFTTRRTTTISNTSTTNTQVTSAMGMRRRGASAGGRPSVPLTCVVAIVESPAVAVDVGADTRARTEEPPA
jgi:hypothetical protein